MVVFIRDERIEVNNYKEYRRGDTMVYEVSARTPAYLKDGREIRKIQQLPEGRTIVYIADRESSAVPIAYFDWELK